jgi:hypothetical protein
MHNVEVNVDMNDTTAKKLLALYVPPYPLSSCDVFCVLGVWTLKGGITKSERNVSPFITPDSSVEEVECVPVDASTSKYLSSIWPKKAATTTTPKSSSSTPKSATPRKSGVIPGSVDRKKSTRAEQGKKKSPQIPEKKRKAPPAPQKEVPAKKAKKALALAPPPPVSTNEDGAFDFSQEGSARTSAPPPPQIPGNVEYLVSFLSAQVRSEQEKGEREANRLQEWAQKESERLQHKADDDLERLRDWSEREATRLRSEIEDLKKALSQKEEEMKQSSQRKDDEIKGLMRQVGKFAGLQNCDVSSLSEKTEQYKSEVEEQKKLLDFHKKKIRLG